MGHGRERNAKGEKIEFNKFRDARGNVIGQPRPRPADGNENVGAIQ